MGLEGGLGSRRVGGSTPTWMRAAPAASRTDTRPLDRRTGEGRVKKKDGHYADALATGHAVHLLDFQRTLQTEMAERPPKWSRELLEWRRRQHMLARQKVRLGLATAPALSRPRPPDRAVGRFAWDGAVHGPAARVPLVFGARNAPLVLAFGARKAPPLPCVRVRNRKGQASAVFMQLH